MSYAHLFKSGTEARKAQAEAFEPDVAPSLQQQEFTLLFTDDEESVLSALRRVFMDENYTILTANSADKALQIMEERPVHLLISNHRMPGMTGAELLKSVRERWPETIRIMLTGYADVNSIMGAVKDGAVYKFITKPWNDEDLRLTVSLALQQYLLMQENRNLKELSSRQQHKIRQYAGLFEENRGMLGDILMKSGLIGQEELGVARKQQEAGEFLGDTLIRLKLLTEGHLLAALQKSLGVEYLDLREVSIAANVARCLPRELCEQSHILPDDLAKITIISKKPQGGIIATGPPGSGKTTMLYSLLAAMMNPNKNFETIEEPVEYFLEEANQVSIHDKIRLSFAQILLATLRQDPDVILVGEMRDFETADTAFKAALTGHMVLSTLHTNSAIASITRLIDMGIKPYILASALEGVIAQRLVRRICENCRIEVTPDPDQMQLLRVPEQLFGNRVYQGAGCSRCNNTGYKGKLGIYEIFLMSDEYRQLISECWYYLYGLSADDTNGINQP